MPTVYVVLYKISGYEVFRKLGHTFRQIQLFNKPHKKFSMKINLRVVLHGYVLAAIKSTRYRGYG